MSPILVALLLLWSLTAEASSSVRGEPCPGPAQAALPPLQPSPEGIWHTSSGSGRPLLFIHGWTMDHRDEAWDYEPVLQHHDGWRRIYVDLPGMGRSAGTTIQDQDETLQRLLAFVDREFGTTRFAIAGTSSGAYLAQAVASQRSNQVTGLLLRVPMTIPDDDKRDRNKAKVLVADKFTSAGMSESLRATHRDAIVQTRCYVESLARKDSDRVTAAQALANRATLDPIRADVSRYALSVSVFPSRKSLAVPVLIITGRQDESVGYRDAWRLVERYPRASYVALDRAEHGFPIDHHNRALFEALVEDWLNRIEETTAWENATP